MPLMLLSILLFGLLSVFISLEFVLSSFKSKTWLKLWSLLQGKFKRRKNIFTFFLRDFQNIAAEGKKGSLAIKVIMHEVPE